METALKLADSWEEIDARVKEKILKIYDREDIFLRSARFNPAEKKILATFSVPEYRRQNNLYVSTKHYDRCFDEGTYILIGCLTLNRDPEVRLLTPDTFASVRDGFQFHRAELHVEKYGKLHPIDQDFYIGFRLAEFWVRMGVGKATIEMDSKVKGQVIYGARLPR